MFPPGEGLCSATGGICPIPTYYSLYNSAFRINAVRKSGIPTGTIPQWDFQRAGDEVGFSHRATQRYAAVLDIGVNAFARVSGVASGYSFR